MQIGDLVEITVAEEGYFKVGDRAILTNQDKGGDWWADFENRQWDAKDRNFCIERGVAECKVIQPKDSESTWDRIDLYKWIDRESTRLDLRADEMKAAIILGLKQYCGEDYGEK